MSSSDAIVDHTPDQYGQVHPHETPELIARKMVDFDKEVKKLKTADAKGIKEAQLKCPDLLTDKFKLMFLRSEVFNADVSDVSTIEASRATELSRTLLEVVDVLSTLYNFFWVSSFSLLLFVLEQPST